MASSKRNYDVFLSFRGKDVRNNFLSHLYADLDRNGIHTFKDSEELRKGEEISPTLMMAIEESRVAIVIFSEDYASSRWCLEELVKIMECKAQKELIVLPVFYKVEPREVREGREAYKRAMAKHETKYGKDPEIVKRWKKALSDAGSLSGWDYNNEDEVEFIRGITKQVSSHLERKTPLYVAKYPVGIDYRAQEVISLSQKESDGDDVLMIGIWGPGGIGKTAIAKAIYNAMERHFEGSTFLERVRETSNKCNGLVELQEKILSQILSPRDLTVYSEGRGSGLIRERLGHKKVLLVLDDVDNCHQLDMLAGGDNWFGKGSRIFVTSRDKHLLTSHGKNRVYEVKPLHHGEALSLFSQHAFPNCKKPEIREDLIDRALHYASGFPLALEVLGSFLRGRREPAWESGLRKLSKSPDKDINQVLKISFDGLGENEREICLDFACFFKGKSIEYIKKVLDGCGFETTIGLEILIDRSLIREEEHGTLQMHDLVQLMVQNIVNQECPDDPGKRSRLWLFDDVQDILYEDTETNAVKAIVLDLPAPKVRTVNPEEITICPNAFRNMKMLRMLILIEVHFSSQGPVYLPNNLRWLEWPNAPDLEFRSGPKKLVALDIPKSHIRQFDGIFKDFKLLKYINFSQCESLVSVPDLSSIPNLESLNLDGCKSLVEVHQSVACHKLKLLSLECCSNLSKFPHKLKAKSLQALNLFGCFKLEKFSDIPEKMEHLEYLDLSSTAIKELPASVENLVSVKIINLRKCKRLPTLPSSVYKLQNLEVLSLGGCSNFVMFPKNLEDSINPNGNLGFRKLYQLDLYDCSLSEVEFLESSSSFPKLGHLRLDGNKFTHLPTCINKYHNLEHLHVSKCGQLQKIPQLPPNVHILKAYGCSSLQEFPDLSSRSSNWLSVDVSSCCELFHKGASTAHVLSCKELPKMIRVDITLTGGEMPEWFLHCKDSYISFMVPGDLRLKFLGIAFCIVLRQGKAVSAQFTIGSNQHNCSPTRHFPSMTSDNMWIAYFSRWEMLIEGELPWDKWGRINVWVSTGTQDRWGLNFIPGQDERLIKWGVRPIIAQEEDDLRIVLQHHQPNETNWSSEERDSEEDNRIDTKEEESSSETDDDSNKEKLSQPNETNWSSEERDSEEDYCTDTEEEESSSETDWQSYEEMWQDSELPCELLPDMHCCESGCRTFKSWKKLMDRQRRIYRKFVQLNGQRLHG